MKAIKMAAVRNHVRHGLVTASITWGNNMPTYSYTHVDSNKLLRDCQSADFDLVQSIKDESIKECPTCLKPVKRIITSAPSFKMAGGTPKFHG